jgi:hypothetical protein
MNDKTFSQIEAWVDGQKRYKLLDTSRRALLQLPDGAFKLWMTLYFHESDDQEVWISLATMIKRSGMSENSVAKWRDSMLKTGWLLKLEGSAADKYSKPTRGAHKVALYRVNDPTPKVEVHQEHEPQPLPLINSDEPQTLHEPQNVMTPKFEGKGSCTVGSCLVESGTVSSSLVASSTPLCGGNEQRLAPPITSLREEKPAPSEARPEEPRRSGMEKLEARSAFWTTHFTDAPSMMFLTYSEDHQVYWIASHSRYKEDPLAPRIGKYRCPACEFTTNSAGALVRHLHAEHKETLRRLHE